jgi:hypothetical protein
VPVDEVEPPSVHTFQAEPANEPGPRMFQLQRLN